MHNVTDRQTDVTLMPIADHTVYQYDRLKKSLDYFFSDDNLRRLYTLWVNERTAAAAAAAAE